MMEDSLISLLSLKQYKQSKLVIYILIFVSLVVGYNSISTEIKVISVPYLSVPYGDALKINYYYSNIYLGEVMQKQGLIFATAN